MVDGPDGETGGGVCGGAEVGTTGGGVGIIGAGLITGAEFGLKNLNKDQPPTPRPRSATNPTTIGIHGSEGAAVSLYETKSFSPGFRVTVAVYGFSPGAVTLTLWAPLETPEKLTIPEALVWSD
jgi:hypothetical protein